MGLGNRIKYSATTQQTASIHSLDLYLSPKIVILLQWEKPRANITYVYLTWIIGYSELEGTQKNHHNSDPGPAKDNPKGHTIYLRTLSKCFSSLAGLALWPLCWGVCSRAQLRELHVVPSDPEGSWSPDRRNQRLCFP